MTIVAYRPYDNEQDDPIGELRKLCRELFPKPYAQEPIRNITAVGAVSFYSCMNKYGGDFRPYLVPEDVKWLSGMFTLNATYKTPPIADDFVLTTVNQEESNGKHDIFAMRKKPKTDLLAICNVRHADNAMTALLTAQTEQKSPLAAFPERWTILGYTIGAKIVTTAGWSEREVRDREFLHYIGGKQYFAVPPLRHPKKQDGFGESQYSIVVRRDTSDPA